VVGVTRAPARSPGRRAAVSPPGGLPRLLPSPPAPALAAHVERFGPMPAGGAGLVAEVARSGLRGRGGSGFPTGRKLEAVVGAAGRRRPFVVANGTEGEPASAKDKTLLVHAPHLVLDGAVLCAGAVGATEVVLCVERTRPAVLRAAETALAERRAAGVDPVPVTLRATPGQYVAGEESALIHWLNGGEAKPTIKPPLPFERGVGGRPTLVQNVETLAHVALVARFGAEWFRAVGTEADPGSALVTIGGGVARPGVYEVPLGASLRGVLTAAGVAEAGPRAALVGGYFGSWLTGADSASLSLGTEAFRAAGSTLGCGVLWVLPSGACGLAESARVAAWAAAQSAGQCGPCVYGLADIARAMEEVVRGDRSGRAEANLHRWLGMVTGRSACRHPDGAARFVESSLRVFADEIARHRHRGPCEASRRAGLLPVPAGDGWR